MQVQWVPLLALTIISFLPVQVMSQVYEAEDAVLTNGATVVEDQSTSGNAYVAQGEGQLSFTINIEQEGYYDIFINTSSPHGEKVNILALDGSTLNFGLGKSSQFSKIKLISQHKLSAGNHQLEIRKSWGWINIDYIEFQQQNSSQRFNLNQELVNPEASIEAIALNEFLLDNYSRKIISGVMTLNSMDESDWLKANTGKEPALLGIDFMHVGRGYTWYNDSIPTKDAMTWYERNGIPALMWHWRDPSKQTEAFYTSETSFDVSKVLDENSGEYDSIISDIDYIAGFMKVLQENGVPVIWRPLHEGAGGWFWWSAKGPEVCKKLYLLMYDRLVNFHELNNLLWVWTREPNDDAWYPGDEYVDIVGRDIYKTGDHNAQELEFNHMNSIYNGNKMLALSETGSFPNVDNLTAEEALWSWFMPWYGKFTREEAYNPLAHWQKTMDHEYVITLDEMPELRTYERQFPDPGTEPVTAIEDQEEDFPSVRAYPTLVTNTLTVESNYMMQSLVVYNSNGQIIFEKEPNVHSTEISFSGLAPGMYVLRVNHSKTLRIVKK